MDYEHHAKAAHDKLEVLDESAEMIAGSGSDVAVAGACAAQAHATLALIGAVNENLRHLGARELEPTIQAQVGRVEFSPGFGLEELQADLGALFDRADGARTAAVYEIRSEMEALTDELEALIEKVGRA